MKRPLIVLLISLTFTGLDTVFAASINYQTRLINTVVDRTNYKSAWNAQSSVKTARTLNNFDLVWGGNNTFSHLTVDFSTRNTSVFFQIAPDAGFGGALYLDGVKLTEKQNNLWWNYNWNNSASILGASIANLSAGHHTLEAFWAENCCNGGGSGRFSLDNGSTWQSLSTANLNKLAPVPVPSAILLFGTGMIWVFYMRRKSIPATAPLSPLFG